MSYGFVDELLNGAKAHRRIDHRDTTLHRRDIGPDDFFVVARFAHALVKVKMAVQGVKDKIPQVLDMGETELTLPVWAKNEEGWHQAGFKQVKRDALCITTPMMRAIVRYLGIREGAFVQTLFRLSMLSSGQGNGDKRIFRHTCTGMLFDPATRQKLGFSEVTKEGFIVDRKRIDEWIAKVPKKKGSNRD
ncbi:hypothetical protein [Geomonas oryzae]|uniref:hypothetical protein n=1 Tax=Geomonas oryzae TaxID=2364273 RepID=UPI00100AD6C5|nr:hypothetical protein [Geomonas oryzae]